MIRAANDHPCWVYDLNDEGDQIHFPTRDLAADCAADYGRPGTERQLPVRCWLASCDGEGCIATEGTEDGHTAHLPAYSAHHAAVDLQELTRVGGHLLCTDCHTPAPAPEPVRNGRPTILTEDDLARVFGALVMLMDGRTALFDPDTHNAVALVESLVQRTATGPGAWRVYVQPFAVQMPLPGMPVTAQIIEENQR